MHNNKEVCKIQMQILYDIDQNCGKSSYSVTARVTQNAFYIGKTLKIEII